MLTAGMRVRAIAGMRSGDSGSYMMTNGGTPPCQCRWDSDGGTYWVRAHDVGVASWRGGGGRGAFSREIFLTCVAAQVEWCEVEIVPAGAAEMEAGGDSESTGASREDTMQSEARPCLRLPSNDHRSPRG